MAYSLALAVFRNPLKTAYCFRNSGWLFLKPLRRRLICLTTPHREVILLPSRLALTLLIPLKVIRAIRTFQIPMTRLLSLLSSRLEVSILTCSPLLLNNNKLRQKKED